MVIFHCYVSSPEGTLTIFPCLKPHPLPEAGTASTSVGDEAGSPGSECFPPSGLANDGALNAAKMAVETQRKEVLT